jgi:hypothetical protein
MDGGSVSRVSQGSLSCWVSFLGSVGRRSELLGETDQERMISKWLAFTCGVKKKFRI